MRILTEEQVEDLVNAPAKQDSLRQARMHEEWLQFFSSFVSYLDTIPSNYNEAASLFFAKYSGILGFGTKKYERLVQVFENELPNIIESISDGYSPIYTASDRVVDLLFSDDKVALEFESLREKVLQDYKFMSTKAHPFITEAVNTIIVVDTDLEGEPYFLPVKIKDVISYDLKFNKDLAYVPYSVEYIIFRRGDSIVAIDAESTRVYDAKDVEIAAVDGKSLTKKELTLEEGYPVAHNLGYCPAVTYYHEYVNGDPLVRRSPITNSFPLMRLYLEHQVGRSWYELYGKYPIFKTIQAGCDFQEGDGKVTCVAGKLMDDARGFIGDCQQCESEGFAFPGSMIEVDPDDEKQMAALGSIGFIQVDVPSLEYNRKRTDELEQKIERYTIGLNDLTTKEAVNEKQISYMQSNRGRFLNRISNSIEVTHKFILDTSARIFAGDKFLGSRVDYGRKFAYLTDQQTISEYEGSKEAGLPENVLYDDLVRVVESKFRSTPGLMQGEKLKLELIPYPTVGFDSALEMFREGGMSLEDLTLKTNFSHYIARFERETGVTVMEFYKEQSIKTMTKEGDVDKAAIVNKIKDFLLKYTTEDVNKAKADQPKEVGNKSANLNK